MCIAIFYGIHYLYSQISHSCELVSSYEKFIRYEDLKKENDSK